jgi:hypothetical protein
MVYLPIGSNGFAQVGRPDFLEKSRDFRLWAKDFFLRSKNVFWSDQNLALRGKKHPCGLNNVNQIALTAKTSGINSGWKQFVLIPGTGIVFLLSGSRLKITKGW